MIPILSEKLNSTDRDMLGWHLETGVKQPYLKTDKNKEVSLTVDYTVWNKLENYEKLAGEMHHNFDYIWNDIKERHNRPEFHKLDLINCLYLLLNDSWDEIKKWCDQLSNNPHYLYNLP